MLVSNAFDNILHQIQKSNLNFQLQMTPFSAIISLKKTVVKDKAGNPIKSSESCTSETSDTISSLASTAELTSLAIKNGQLEKNLETIKCDYAKAVNDCNDAHLRIKFLEKSNIPVKKEADAEKVIADLEHELERVRIENKMYQQKIKEQDEEIFDLNKIVKTKNEVSNNLNKQLNEIRVKTEKETALIKKIHKKEVKSWRKNLGEERRQKIKLEKELQSKIVKEGEEEPVVNDVGNKLDEELEKKSDRENKIETE